MIRQESAQTVALQALGWLAGQEGPFAAFLSLSGLDAAALRDRAGDPDLLASVLDFLLSDEGLLLDFCREAGLAFDLPLRARAALPGGDLPHWT
jgi:hypothetical protein